jgi:SulP family sulfate permease
MESVSIAKSMSQMTGDHFDPSKEMIGQGLASFVGGFFYCMPSSGSPSRTVINIVNGAKTRFASIFSGLSVLIFLLLFAGLIGYIPVPALAAIVIVSSAGLINFDLIKLTWQSRLNSRIGMIITFVSSLVLPLEYAIYLGVISTILIYLGESGQVKMNYILEDEDGQFIELPLNKISEQNPKIAILNVEGDLYFAAIEGLQDQVERILKTDIEVLILRFRRTHLLASTGIIALNQIIRTAKEQDVDILFCGIQEEIREPLEAAGVIRTIGPSHTFTASDVIFESTQRALEKAKEILEEKEAS